MSIYYASNGERCFSLIHHGEAAGKIKNAVMLLILACYRFNCFELILNINQING